VPTKKELIQELDECRRIETATQYRADLEAWAAQVGNYHVTDGLGWFDLFRAERRKLRETEARRAAQRGELDE
jgi:hypothetical protein